MSEMGDSGGGAEADGGAEDSGGQEASAESIVEASGGSAAESPAGEPGEGEPADAGPDEGPRPYESENDTGGGDTVTETKPIDEIGDESDAGDSDAEPGENEPAGTGADELVAGTAAQPQDGQPADEADEANEAALTRPLVIGGPAGADNQSPPGQVAERDQPDRPDISMKYPSDYKESDAPPPAVDSPHQSPETWAKDINPGKDEVGGRFNCGECARAVQDTWSGDASVAATMTPGRTGEPASRMNEWAGSSPEQATMNQMSDRLNELGPGSSAIVRCRWEDGSGHYFNSTNDSGTIKAVDGQSGQVESWPPTRAGLGFDESDMSASVAFYFDSNGKAVR